MNKTIIETPSLLLRRFTASDASTVYRQSQEESARIWLRNQVYRDEAHAASGLDFLISQYETTRDPGNFPLVLGVQLKSSGELIGHVGLSPLFNSVEVRFAIEQSQQRKGFASEAVRAMCTWAKGEFRIAEIIGVTDPKNVASQRTLLRAGFIWSREQVMKFKGEKQLVVIFALS